MGLKVEQIDKFLEAELDRYIEETIRLCAQPSISATGEGVAECSDLISQMLESHNFAVQRFETPGNPIIVATAEGESERTLLLYNHYDVQPADPLEEWTTPPFQPSLRDGAIYARGACDDKGEIVARLAAIDAVRNALGGRLPCRVIMVVEGEEEIGSPNIADFVQQHKDLLTCHGAIWEGGGIEREGPMNVLGFRGVLSVELSVRTMKIDAHSGWAHVLPSAAWRLTWALSTLKSPDERILIPGFYDDVRPPTELDRTLIGAYPDLDGLQANYKEQFGLDEFLHGLTGVELELRVFLPTCNIQGITTGYQGEGNKTIIPAKASAKIDFRLVPDQQPSDIAEKLRAHLDHLGFTDVEIERMGGSLPVKLDGDDPLVLLTARTAEEVYEQEAIRWPMSGGSTPVYAFSKPLGDIPVVSAGVGYWENRIHAPNEHIRIVDLLNGARHIARIIDGFADL